MTVKMRGGYSRVAINTNIASLVNDGVGRANAIRASLDNARKEYRKKHPHGMVPDHLADPDEKRRRAAFRGKNPVPLSVKAQLRNATTLYENFTGHEAEVVDVFEKPDFPGVLLKVGKIDGILYSTVRDGKLEKYIHEFSAKSRPLFCVTPDGTQIVLLGGEYDFTERGIVDRR